MTEIYDAIDSEDVTLYRFYRLSRSRSDGFIDPRLSKLLQRVGV